MDIYTKWRIENMEVKKKNYNIKEYIHKIINPIAIKIFLRWPLI